MPVEKKDYYYLRLSKEDGDVEAGSVEESCSIQSQRICIRQFLRKQGFKEDDFGELVDDGFTGTNMERPGMRKLLGLVEAGKVRTIVVRDLSRFARNYLEAGHYLEFIFPAYDVRFISIQDGFDSQALGETTGGLELAVHNLTNQLYSKDISRKIKSAVDLKKMNGEYVYGTAPYGYRKGPDKNTIVVDQEAAIVVKRIFDWAAEGVTISQIARRLNDDGVITPSVYLAAVRGKYKTRAFWTYESVRNILHNRIYTGDTVPFKSHVVRVGSNRVRHVPEGIQQVIPDTHEAIVSRMVYDKALMVVKSTKAKTKVSGARNPFTSKLFCGCCGNRLVKGKAQNKNWYCTTARYKTGLGCEEIKIPEEKLAEIVLHAIVTQCRLMKEKIGQLKKEETTIQSEFLNLEKEHRRLRMQIEQAAASKIQYYEEYVRGTFSKEEFILKKQKETQKENELKERLDVVELQLGEMKNLMENRTEQISDGQALAKYQDVTKLTPELMRELIRQIIIYPDGRLRIEWNFCNEWERAVE
ncbi:MAG: recombinase family protein [Lachnospiraceae bacterium]|nr:recombinase family protein [Lachnospiraceae bacterium]